MLVDDDSSDYSLSDDDDIIYITPKLPKTYLNRKAIKFLIENDFKYSNCDTSQCQYDFIGSNMGTDECYVM